MKVLKFGGTSVGTVRSLTNVKQIVESLGEPAVIVVSALGGLTDKLISTARMAAQGDMQYEREMEAIASRHFDIIAELVLEDKRQDILSKATALLKDLKRNYDGVALIRDLPAKTLDVIVSFGERLSSTIIAGIIEDATLHDSLTFIKTEKWFNKNIADSTLTDRLISEEFTSRPPYRAIVPGFISTDRDNGEITNLGRGGSDFTAALIAAAIDADILEIWTDVDGFMTSDPRIIPAASVIPEMSFVESMELCSFGAKVIYPPTIYPVFHKNIPIKILNTFNPAAPGTHISDKTTQSSGEVKGISAIRNTCLITLSGALATNVAEINSRTYNALARKGISVFLVSQPTETDSFSFAVADTDVEEATDTLEQEYAPELNNGILKDITVSKSLATVAVVGDNLRKEKGIGGRIFNTLERNGIRTIARSEGVSDTTLTYVVSLEDTNRAIALIHTLFFE